MNLVQAKLFLCKLLDVVIFFLTSRSSWSKQLRKGNILGNVAYCTRFFIVWFIEKNVNCKLKSVNGYEI